MSFVLSIFEEFAKRNDIQKILSQQSVVKKDVIYIDYTKKDENIILSMDMSRYKCLPFCGVILSDCCQGVRFNRRLYSQCFNSKKNGEIYCERCFESMKNNSNNKPINGNIYDRKKHGLKYKPEGKPFRCVSFANVVRDKNLDMGNMKMLAAELGWRISDEDLLISVNKRGRPRKKKKKKRKKGKVGRPKKEIKKLNNVEKIEKLNEQTNQDYSYGIDVNETIINNVVYYVDVSGNVYNDLGYIVGHYDIKCQRYIIE